MTTTAPDLPLDHRTAPAILSRGALLIAMVAAWFAVVAYYAGFMWMSVVSLVVTDGLLVLGWVVSAGALGHLLLEATRLIAKCDARQSSNGAASCVASCVMNPALSVATSIGIGLGVFSLSALGLGLIGALNRLTTIALPVLSIIAWFAFVGRNHLGANDIASTRIGNWLKRPAGWHWLFLATAPMLGVATVAAAMVPGFMWKPDDPHPYDVVSYHLQIPREWYEIGRIVPLTHNVFSYFPFNVEMQFLLGMNLRGGPWAGMYFAQFMSMAYGVLAVMGTYGVARLVSAQAGATIAAVAMGTMPWMPMLSSVAYVEPALMLYVALAVGWLIKACPPPSGEPAAVSWRDAVVAGVCGGLACGVKLTAGPMLLAPLVVAVFVMLGRRGVGRAVIVGVVFGVVAMVVLSPWLVRNAVWTGNPFFPNATGVFGAAHWLPGQVERYAVAHTSPAGLAGAVPRVAREVTSHWQYGYVFVPLAVVGLATSVRRSRVVRFVATAIAVQLAFWLTTHAIGRFMLVGVPPAAVLVATNDRGARKIVAATAVVVAMFVGWIVGIHPRLEHFAGIGCQGVFGMVDVGFIQPEELQSLYDTGATVHFVGDAQVFLHKARTAQLRYRGVFDVRPDTDDPVTAWTGRPLNELPPGEWVLIDPAEIRRLSSTYRHVPDVPPGFPGPRDRPFLLDRDGRMIVPRR
jgi:hypothetical protein